MIELLQGGAYLVNGTEIVADAPDAQQAIYSKTGKNITKEEAAKETIAYGILESHNTSGSMEKLKVRFDKLTSHDITFVGIIQTARASGLTKFPMPYVLTNCHNSLCAVGGSRAFLEVSREPSLPSPTVKPLCASSSSESHYPPATACLAL